VRAGESLLLWVLDADGRTTEGHVLARPGALDDGLLAWSSALAGGQLMVVTRETGEPGREPTGEALVRAELPQDGGA
jgi:hypothetical protein